MASVNTIFQVEKDDGVGSLGASWRIPRPSVHGSSTSTSARTFPSSTISSASSNRRPATGKPLQSQIFPSSSSISSNTMPRIETVQDLSMSPPRVPALTQFQDNLLSPHHQINGTPWSSAHSTSGSSMTEGSESLLLTPSRLPKDLDTASIASSMHFTIVNGMGGSQKKNSEGCCHGSYQLPILVVTMTFLLFLGILAAVLFIQIRARNLRHT